MKRLSEVIAPILAVFFAFAALHGATGAAALEAPPPPPTPDDFAYGLTIEVDGSAPVYEAPLPVSFYQGVVRQDLGDACVFNGKGEILPFMIRKPVEPQSTTHDVPDIPIFPLVELAGDKKEGLSMRVRRDDSGTIIDVDESSTPAPTNRVSAYLLDLSFLEKRATALRFQWQHSDESFHGRISIEGSDDLDHWRMLKRDVTIAYLHYGGRFIDQRRVEFDQSIKARYLKISWPDSMKDAKLTGLIAEVTEAPPEQPREWTLLEPAPKSPKPGDYTFDARGLMPVDRLRVRFPQKNTLVMAVISSRSNEKDSWKPRHSAALYRLEIEGEEMVSPDVTLPQIRDRYWMLSISPHGGTGESGPQLELGWIPQSLFFLARGDGPFRLAYGSAKVQASSLGAEKPLRQFTENSENKKYIKTARIGGSAELGGESRLRAPSAHPWKQWILWLLLIAGVAVLAWMAMRLYKEMNRQDTDGSS